jgi:2,3-bisphosphoglycerate-dependent phosphoglycerate mutase
MPSIYSFSNADTFHITLLRHGESRGNAQGILQGQSDFPLTETGRKQVQALADRWQSDGQTFDRIISSPLARARETAEILEERLQAPLELSPLWKERDNGLLAGLTRAEAEQTHPRPDFINLYQPIGENGESQWELYLRAGRAVQELVTRPPGSFLVVSHGGLLNMVMYVVLGITPQANFHGARFRFRNTAFAIVTYKAQRHEWRCEAVNDRAHWQDND